MLCSRIRACAAAVDERRRSEQLQVEVPGQVDPDHRQGSAAGDDVDLARKRRGQERDSAGAVPTSVGAGQVRAAKSAWLQAVPSATGMLGPRPTGMRQLDVLGVRLARGLLDHRHHLGDYPGDRSCAPPSISSEACGVKARFSQPVGVNDAVPVTSVVGAA